MEIVPSVWRPVERFLGLFPRGGGLLPLLIALFVLVRLGEASGSAPAWVRGYADDLLCLPLVLSVALAARRKVGKPGSSLLPLSHGIVAVILFGLIFEVVLPRFKTAAVADPWDIVMYLAGFLVFQFGLNRSARSAKPLRTGSFVPTFPG